MARCYENCKHNDKNFCRLYRTEITVSNNPAHPGLLLHPLQGIENYFKLKNDESAEEALIELAEKYLSEHSTVHSITTFSREKKFVTYKQKKLLLKIFFECYKPKEF